MRINFNLFQLAMLASAAFCASHCGKDVVFDIDANPQLVVYSVVAPDTTVQVSVTRSKLPDQSLRFEPVRDAKVVLSGYNKQWVLDQFIPPGRLGDVGYYTSKQPVALRPGGTYQLAVNVPGQPVATATAKIPMLPVVRDVSISKASIKPPRYPPILGPDKILEGNIKFTLQDPPGETNHYALRITYRSDYYNPQIGKLPPPLIDSLHLKTLGSYKIEGLGQQDLSYLLDDVSLFDDVDFNGQSREVLLNIRSLIEVQNILPESITLEIWSLNEDYHRHIITHQQQVGINSDPFAEPLNVYSNVSGGLGLFAGFSRVKYVLKI